MECIQVPYRLIFYYFPVSPNRLFIQTHMQHNYLQWMNPFLFECAPEISFHAWILSPDVCILCALINSKKEIFTPVPFRLHRIPRYWNPKNTEKMNHKNVVIVCTMYRMTEFSYRKLNIMVIWWRQRRHYHHQHWCHYMIWSYRISVTRVTSHPII